MDSASEERLFDTLDSISTDINTVKVDMAGVKSDAVATKSYCKSISTRVKELDKDGTRPCKTNKTEIDNLDKRVDKVERSKANGSKRPMIIGAGTVASIVAIMEGFKMWFTKGPS